MPGGKLETVEDVPMSVRLPVSRQVYSSTNSSISYRLLQCVCRIRQQIGLVNVVISYRLLQQNSSTSSLAWCSSVLKPSSAVSCERVRQLFPVTSRKLTSGLVEIHPKTQNFTRFSITSNLAAHVWNIKYR